MLGLQIPILTGQNSTHKKMIKWEITTVDPERGTGMSTFLKITPIRFYFCGKMESLFTHWDHELFKCSFPYVKRARVRPAI